MSTLFRKIIIIINNIDKYAAAAAKLATAVATDVFFISLWQEDLKKERIYRFLRIFTDKINIFSNNYVRDASAFTTTSPNDFFLC